MNAQGAARGRLLLVPATLDLGGDPVPLQDVLPHGVLTVAATLKHWRVENARSARAFLKRVDGVVPLAHPLQTLDMAELPRPRKGADDAVPPATWDALLAPAEAGHDIGLLSEAGLPAVADPGAALVAAAHRQGLVVVPLPGASALVLALAASGLEGQSFAFVGYLPQPAPERAERLRALEALSRRQGQTQLWIETPYRNAAMVEAMVTALSPSTRVTVSAGLTLGDARTFSATAAQWRKAPPVLTDRLPAVFGLLAC
jgi:16S rRNA (cytidine1402-2'-O)-methyltransferase